MKQRITKYRISSEAVEDIIVEITEHKGGIRTSEVTINFKDESVLMHDSSGLFGDRVVTEHDDDQSLYSFELIESTWSNE